MLKLGFWENFKKLPFETKIFVAVLPLGIILRLVALFARDIWFDEAFTYQIAKLPLKDLLRAILTDNNPPIYYLLIHFVLYLGKSIFLLRTPSLILNLLSVYVLYKMVKTNFNKKIAILASSLYLLSPLEVYMSSEARLHSLAMFFAMLIIYFFMTVAKKPKPYWIFFFTLFFILGLYTQYYIGLLMLPFSILVIFKRTNIFLKKWLLIISLVVLAVIPWLILSSQTLHNGCACSNTLLALPATLVSPIIAGIGDVSLRSFPQLPPLLFIFFTFISITAILFFLKGLIKCGKFSLIYLTPLIFLSLTGFSLPVFSPKAAAIVSPLFFLFVSHGILKSKFKKVLAFGLVASLFSVSFIQITDPFFQGQKFAPLVNTLRSDDQAPILHTSTYTYYSLNYYLEKRKQVLITSNALSPDTVKFIGGEKTNFLYKNNTVWLVNTKKWVDPIEYEKEITKKYNVNSVSIEYLQRKNLH